MSLNYVLREEQTTTVKVTIQHHFTKITDQSESNIPKSQAVKSNYVYVMKVFIKCYKCFMPTATVLGTWMKLHK